MQGSQSGDARGPLPPGRLSQLRLVLQPSRVEQGCIIAIHTLALLVIARMDWSMTVASLTTLLVTGNGCYRFAGTLLILPWSVVELWLDLNGRAVLFCKSGTLSSRLVRVAYRSPPLAVLDFRVLEQLIKPEGRSFSLPFQPWRTYRLMLVFDSIDGSARRQLACLLNYIETQGYST